MMCLCRLHNYCTDASLARNERLHPPQLIDEDGVTIRLHGGVAPHRQYREEFQRHIFRPAHLLDGGNHNDDVHRQDRRTEQGRQQRGGVRGETCLGNCFVTKLQVDVYDVHPSVKTITTILSSGSADVSI